MALTRPTILGIACLASAAALPFVGYALSLAQTRILATVGVVAFTFAPLLSSALVLIGGILIAPWIAGWVKSVSKWRGPDA